MPPLLPSLGAFILLGLRHLIIWGAFGSIAGCLGIPQVETTLYQSPQGQVVLKTFTNSSVIASQPFIINLELLEKSFRGLRVREDQELLDRLLRGEGQDLPIFTDQEARFLALIIKDALAQATSEEFVWFQLTHQESENSHSTSGALYLSKDLLLLGLDNFQADHHSSSLSSKPSFSPTRIRNWSLVFSPEEANRTDPLSSEELPIPARIGSVAIALNALSHHRGLKRDDGNLTAPQPRLEKYDNQTQGIQALQEEIEKLQKQLEGQNQKLKQLERQLGDTSSPIQ